MIRAPRTRAKLQKVPDAARLYFIAIARDPQGPLLFRQPAYL